jgi:solute carrier family 25 (mitochondrial carnitine/acylcarnitine transporter), member 20/29
MLTFEWYADMKYNVDDAAAALTGRSILVEVNTVGSRPTVLSTGCFTLAGAVTGFGVSFLACPFELLKVGRQMSGMLAGKQSTSFDETLGRHYRDKGTFSAGYELYKRVGIGGLYSGIHLHARE